MNRIFKNPANIEAYMEFKKKSARIFSDVFLFLRVNVDLKQDSGHTGEA